MDQLSKPGKTIDLGEVEEGDTGEAISEDRTLLKAFKHANVHFHLMSDPDLKSLKEKKKFRGLFDGGVLSINSAVNIGEDLSTLFRDKARVHCEAADYLIALTPEQRIEFRKQILVKVRDAGWSVIPENPYTHHFLLEVKNKNFGSELTEQSTAADEEDFMDLSGL